MASNRSHKRGARAAIDWESAFAFYAALPPAERSYQAVADEFGVSVRTVETHGREEQWKERLNAIKAETRARTFNELTEARTDEVKKLRRLIDASEGVYAEALRNGMRMSPADLERLNRLSLALIEEASTPPLVDAVVEDRPPERTMEHAGAVLEALIESGALEALGLTRITPDTDQEAKQKED